jgi:hypothetical protein
MATRLAAAIESALDLEVTLVVGHDAIYEVSLDGEVVYSNMSKCGSGFPDESDIAQLIGKAIGVTPKLGAPPKKAGQSEGCC